MERFTKIANGWILLTVFEKSSILEVWVGSEYVSHYQVVFSLIIIEAARLSPKNLYNVISILFNCLEQRFTL